MANDNQISLELIIEDGTVKKAFQKVTEQGEAAGNKLTNVFDKIGLNGLGGSIVAVNQGLELMSKAGHAVKEVFDSIVDSIKEADHIKLVNQQFEILSARAGIVGSELKDAFEKAANGTVATTEVLGAANKALIDLGHSAEKLPEIFELARKVGKLSGQDTLAVFEQLNFAIQSGNTKALRAVGIFIDSNKAMDDFSKTVKTASGNLKVTANDLSLVGREQAILNAVLEKGNLSFKDLGGGADTATLSFKQFKVATTELGESASKIIAGIFGPIVSEFAKGATIITKTLADAINPDSGPIEQQIRSLEERLFDLNKNKPLQGLFPGASQEVDTINAKLVTLRASLIDIKKKTEEGKQDPASLINLPTAQQIQAKNDAFQSAFQQAENSNLQLQIAAAQKIQDEIARNAALDLLAQGQKEQAERDHLSRLEKIRKEYADIKGGNETERRALENQERIKFTLDIEKIELETEERKAKKLKDIQAQTKSILVSGISSTLQAVGVALQKGEDAFSAFKKGVFGIVGDLMIQLGTAIIAQAVAIDALAKTIATKTGGFGIAAGAALIIAGAALKSSAEGSGGGTSSGGGGADLSGGINSGIGTIPETATNIPTQSLVEPRPNVVLNINGNVLDRRQTGLELVDVLQEAFDTQGAQVRSFA